MTVEELTNIFLRLEMADKAKDSEFLFRSSEKGVDPFPITGVILDEDGDVGLESDDRMEEGLSAAELAAAVSVYDGNKTIYFVHIDREGEPIIRTWSGVQISHRASVIVQMDVLLLPPIFSKHRKSWVPGRKAAALFIASTSRLKGQK